MKTFALKKLNSAKTADGVEADLEAAGFVPFEEGGEEGLSLMTIFKSREKHTSFRRKSDGVYVKLQCFTSPEGAEGSEFIALSAENRSGRTRVPLYCKMYRKNIE